MCAMILLLNLSYAVHRNYQFPLRMCDSLGSQLRALLAVIGCFSNHMHRIGSAAILSEWGFHMYSFRWSVFLKFPFIHNLHGERLYFWHNLVITVCFCASFLN